MVRKKSAGSVRSPVPAAAVAVKAPAVVPVDIPQPSMVAYLDGLVEMLRGYVPRAMYAHDPEAIHQARVCTRRLKAALDLVDPLVPRDHLRPFASVLRKLRRTLGPLRDLDVMIARLDSADASDAHFAASAWLSEKLQAERNQQQSRTDPKSVSRFLAKLGTWWGLREDIAAIEPAVGTVLAESIHLQLDAFGEQADALSAASADAALRRPDPHELRIAGKALRYTLDMARAQGHELPPGAGKQFKQMQELLGQWHDHVVMAERCMEVSLRTQLPLHDTSMQARVLELARDAIELAGERLTEFSDTWNSNGGGLSIGIRDAFPLTRAAGTASGHPSASYHGGPNQTASTAEVVAAGSPVPAADSTVRKSESAKANSAPPEQA